MYNRYIPQGDGSHRRRTIPDSRPSAPSRPVAAQQSSPIPQQPLPWQPSSGGFFRQLLPDNLDSGDLLVIVLLLLMAGDSQEEKNTALLTLALYLFL